MVRVRDNENGEQNLADLQTRMKLVKLESDDLIFVDRESHAQDFKPERCGLWVVPGDQTDESLSKEPRGDSKLGPSTQIDSVVTNNGQANEESADPKTDDPNEVVETHSRYSVSNLFCPLTGKSVVELSDPVWSEECQHIYEQEAAHAYITERGNGLRCAIAGCSAPLWHDKLKCDSTLVMNITQVREEIARLTSTQLATVIELNDD